MIEPQSLNLASLPWLPLEAKAAFPRQPAIYFAIDSVGIVQYVGRSTDPKARWESHHRYNDLNEVGSIKIAYLFVDEAALLPEIEAALITWFAPPLNVVMPPVTASKAPMKVVKVQTLSVPDLGLRIMEARVKDSRSLRVIAKAADMTPMNWYKIEAEETKSLPIDTHPTQN